MRKRSRTPLLCLESIESRLVPSSTTVIYSDVDGDIVRVVATLPGKSVPPLDAADFVFVGGGAGGQLETLTLRETGFAGAVVGFSVTKRPTGDGLAHVGFIDATGVDLNRVSVKGDLGKIVAGDAITANDSGLNSLQARTMGTLGLLTQGGASDLTSTITGALGALTVAGDFTDASLFVSGGVDGRIGSVYIGGDLTGGPLDSSGQVFSAGSMGKVRIDGSLTGGDGVSSGQVFSNASIGPVWIGGGLIGGSGFQSGQVFSAGGMGDIRITSGLIGGAGVSSGVVNCNGQLGTVRIGGDLVGGVGANSGFVFSAGAMGAVSIGGDLAGGTGFASGRVRSGGNMGAVAIGGSLIGGSISGAASLSNSGEIRSVGRIARVTIGGSLIAGTDASAGSLTRCGAIIAGDDLGPVTIRGSIVGNSSNPATIIARGQLVKPSTGFDVAIAGLNVQGEVRFARILAGFDLDQAPANADASIGSIVVGRDWVASSVVAGAQDAGSPGWGIDDTLQTGGNTGLAARVAGITIKGDATGTLVAGDHFGFVAQQIDKLMIGSRAFALTAGPSNDAVAIPFTNDLRLLEAI